MMAKHTRGIHPRSSILHPLSSTHSRNRLQPRRSAITTLPSKDLVLIGAGHTNLHVVRMWRMQPIADVRLTLVSPFSRSTYSGMLPGTLAGLYTPDDMEIDLHRFATSCGARLIVEPAVGLDPERRRILLRDRPPIRYDVAVVGIGSVPGQRELWEGKPNVLSIKPMATFLARLEAAVGSRVAPSPQRGEGWGEGAGRRSALFANGERRLDHPSPPTPLPKGERGERATLSFTIVGAGAGGTEITFCLEAWLRRRGIAGRVTLLDANGRILAGYSAGTVSRAVCELERRGIAVMLGRRVSTIGEREVTFSDGTSLASDLVIWASSAAAPSVLEGFALPKTPDGFLAVRPTLQTTAEFPVFAVGDTASFVSQPVPKAGVYAVREGPVLWENLQRIFSGRDLVPYNPQRGFLSLLNTGDESAILEYRGFSAQGRWVWKLKDYIDRKFMRMYQAYGGSVEFGMRSAEDGGRWTVDGGRNEVAAAMRCLGCGGKVGSNVLAAALERLRGASTPLAPLGRGAGGEGSAEKPHAPPLTPNPSPPRGEGNSIVTLHSPLTTHHSPALHAEDAAVINPQSTPVELLSVDFFPAFLDDPYLIGRIAALHALSDIWAMGGEPQGVLAMVTIPGGEPRQQTELLFQLLAGGKRELDAHSVELWGGHTTEGPELNIGFTVTGRLNGKPPLAKGGLRPGDKLVLTKPLGTGTLLVAHRQCAARAVWVEAMLAQMLIANAVASRAARDHGATAVTDVTGFGLAGHLLEMLDAGGVAARLSLGSLPLLDGFAELATTKKYRSSLDPANRASEARMRIGDDSPLTPNPSPQRGEGSSIGSTNHPGYHALFDPQTAGGLLISVPASRVESLVAELRNAGYSSASVVGEVLAPDSGTYLCVVP